MSREQVKKVNCEGMGLALLNCYDFIVGIDFKLCVPVLAKNESTARQILGKYLHKDNIKQINVKNNAATIKTCLAADQFFKLNVLAEVGVDYDLVDCFHSDDGKFDEMMEDLKDLEIIPFNYTVNLIQEALLWDSK